MGICAAPDPLWGQPDYLRDIKPLLQERCYSCHGGLKQKAGLRLDTAERMLAGGENGPVLKRGNPVGSEILARVTAANPEDRMPPEHEGLPLTDEQTGWLREWIAAGAPAPADEKGEADPKDHWAFQPRTRPPVPTGANPGWVRNPIDAFLARQHEQHGLTPQPEASKPVLLRRLYLDLIGLPPTPAELEAFERDSAPDAYDRVVNRLLDDPRHGQRWARHWMDIWRYSDAWGLGEQLRNSQLNLWHWRDWIVDSLNAGLPYDEMVRQMLAADELYPTDPAKLRATGFLARNWFLFNRNPWMDEAVEHVGKGFLGITMNCTKCHDHKYDPISQADFYRLRAFFEPHHVRLDLGPGETDPVRHGMPRVFDALPDAPTYLYVRGEESRPDTSVAIAPGVPEVLAFKPLVIQPVALPPEAWEPERNPWVLESHLAAARKKLVPAAAALAKAREVLAQAEKRAATAQASAAAPVAAEVADPAALVETFATLDAKRWRIGDDDWSHQPGRVMRKRDGASMSGLRLIEPPPRDFDATLKFTIRGGSTYRSVGLAFDLDDAEFAKPLEAQDGPILVYASAWKQEQKVQASFSRGGALHYPADGKSMRSIHLDREHTLRVQARDTRIRVSLDGEPVLAWRSPLPRRGGAMQITTFDALADFHSFTLAPLRKNAVLEEPDQKAKPAKSEISVEEAKASLRVAELALVLAEAERTSAERRAEALRAEWATAADASTKREAAVRAERSVEVARAQHAVADAERRLLRPDGKKVDIEKDLKKAQETLSTASQKADAEVKPGDTFTRFVGATWATTRYRKSDQDDPALDFPRTSTGRRRALADWITAPRNPLTARVAVNHIWSRHMGTPLVASLFEFGRKGAPPAHPELLDWLASELVESGWDMKHLHRVITTSAVYRRSSSLRGGEAAAARDPDNLRWWRRAPIRIESQAVRDSILALTGDLDISPGGPPVPPSAQADSKRRSLYFTHSNNERNTFLTAFDEADVRECYRREQSIVPQQALALANSRLVLDAAPRIAGRIGGDPADDDAFVRAAFRLVLCADPTADEAAACRRALADLRKVPGLNPAQARAQVIWALINHNDFVTLR